MAGPSAVGDSGHAGRRDRSPRLTPHPGEPDPRCADEELAGEEHGHARRDVVPRDHGGVRVGRVVADEHGHGIGFWKHARPRPRGHGTDAADDEERAYECVKHGASRWVGTSGPRAGRGAFPQGYIRRERPPPEGEGGCLTRVPDTRA